MTLLIVFGLTNILFGFSLGMLFCTKRVRKCLDKTGKLIDEAKTLSVDDKSLDEKMDIIQGRLDFSRELIMNK